MAITETAAAVDSGMVPQLRVVRGESSVTSSEDLIMGAVWDSGREGYALSEEQAALYGLVTAGGAMPLGEELNPDLLGISRLVAKRYVTHDARTGRLHFTAEGAQRASQIVLSNMYHVPPTVA